MILMRSMAACAFAAATLFTGLAALAAEVAPGKPAPDFTAIDSNGAKHTLSSYKGRIVVLEWTNHDCPYVRKHYGTGNMQAHQEQATAAGAVWLTVVSSAPGLQGHVNALEANKLTEDRKAKPTAVLLDPEGHVGRLYAARVSPHMFVIGRDGSIVYMGAMDDKPTANHADVPVARPYVREALAAAEAGKPAAIATTRPYGCSVKYAEPRS